MSIVRAHELPPWISKQTLVLMLGRHQQRTAGASWGFACSVCSPQGSRVTSSSSSRATGESSSGKAFLQHLCLWKGHGPHILQPFTCHGCSSQKKQAPHPACSCIQVKQMLVRHLRAEIWRNLEVDAAWAQPLSSDPQQWYLQATQSLAVSRILLFSITPPCCCFLFFLNTQPRNLLGKSPSGTDRGTCRNEIRNLSRDCTEFLSAVILLSWHWGFLEWLKLLFVA